MATQDVMVAPAALPERVVPRPVVKLSWGSILGGLVVALGVWLMLTVLGLAIGLSAVDPNQPATLKTAGMTTGIWSLVVPLVALFVGGVVASRTAGIVDRPAGAIHGAVLWAFATIIAVVMTGAVVRGIADLAGSIGGTAASAIGSQAPSIDATDLVGPINDRLAAEGKPPIAPEQLQAAMRDAASMAIQQGRFDKETFARALSQDTALSRTDARDIADRIEAQVRTQTQQVERGALQAADTTGKAMWWVFFGMTLSLVTAVAGATIGVSRKQRVAASSGPVAVVDRHVVHP